LIFKQFDLQSLPKGIKENNLRRKLMHSTSKVRRAVLILTVLLSGIGVFASEIDDYVPEVTDRVARISFVQGDVQIRRADTQDWEVAVLNLPIVEGDEIASDGNGRFEIQFNI
jgi:hypothetical protein